MVSATNRVHTPLYSADQGEVIGIGAVGVVVTFTSTARRRSGYKNGVVGSRQSRAAGLVSWDAARASLCVLWRRVEPVPLVYIGPEGRAREGRAGL